MNEVLDDAAHAQPEGPPGGVVHGGGRDADGHEEQVGQRQVLQTNGEVIGRQMCKPEVLFKNG